MFVAAVVSVPFLYGYCIGYPRIAYGRWTKRHTTWYGLSMLFPFPVYRGGWYYYYESGLKEETKHGELRLSLDGVKLFGNYRDGEMYDVQYEIDSKGVVLAWVVYEEGSGRCRCRPNLLESQVPAQCLDTVLDKGADLIGFCCDWCRDIN